MARVPIEVRTAGSDDLDDVLRLWSLGREEVVRLGRPVPPAEQIARRLAQSLSAGQVEVLLARREGEPVGFVLLHETPLSVMSETPALFVDELFVAPWARRHGVARAMLGQVAARAERGGADQIVSSVTPLARETQRFFARLGFSPLAVRRAVAPALLRRRLAAQSPRGDAAPRGHIEDLLSRRRAQRARARHPHRFGPAAGTTGPDAAGWG